MIIFESTVVVLALLATQTRADGSSDDVVPTWVEDGGWIILVLACLAMFYGLATVVEEFFVPALNTVRFYIKDRVRLLVVLSCRLRRLLSAAFCARYNPAA